MCTECNWSPFNPQYCKFLWDLQVQSDGLWPPPGGALEYPRYTQVCLYVKQRLSTDGVAWALMEWLNNPQKHSTGLALHYRDPGWESMRRFRASWVMFEKPLPKEKFQKDWLLQLLLVKPLVVFSSLHLYFNISIPAFHQGSLR